MIDRWLIHRILSGDGQAEERFVREHYASILRFLRHLTRSHEDSTDLTQRTFLKARASLDGFRGESPLRAWLHRIAYREYLQWLRDRKPDSDAIPETLPASRGLSEDALVLEQAIQQLPPDLRTTFVLREVQRLSTRDVATLLDIPEGTVKSRCFLAKQRLRELLADTWTLAEPHPILEVNNGI